MKKLMVLALVLALGFVLSNVCSAQKFSGVEAVGPEVEMTVSEVGYGLQDCCPDPCTATYAPRSGVFGRRAACRPYMVSPCSPCTTYAPEACTPCATPISCEQPCDFNDGCAPYGYGHGYGHGYGYSYGCGYPYGYGHGAPYGYGYGCGYGYGYGCGYPYGFRTPIRNFFARVFAPRPYIGYDAYYGPYGDCCGYGYGY